MFLGITVNNYVTRLVLSFKTFPNKRNLMESYKNLYNVKRFRIILTLSLLSI